MITIGRVSKFVVIGVCATLIHIFVAATLIEGATQFSPGPANVVAFIVATTFSYIGNTKWSFSENFNTKNAGRFTVTACVGCALAYLLSSTADYFGLHYLIGIGFVVICIPMLSFLAHVLWTYRNEEDG